ncbi:uncharacterized protein LOC129590173 isoform X2 [Paramacrobiotus metropolitanus]|nr:uncharacterized protein LOC129590173 isoform X2 [Paramacrobiotus metropolitanus]
MNQYPRLDLCTISNGYYGSGDAPSDNSDAEQEPLPYFSPLSNGGRLTPCSSNSQELYNIHDPYGAPAENQQSLPSSQQPDQEAYQSYLQRFRLDCPRGIRLNAAWTYWYIITEKGEADWKENMKPMCTFDYKEQFWGMWNTIKPPSELPAKREMALFRGGFGRRPVWPDWNDAENIDGGRWKIIFKVNELPQIVDNFWRDLMVHCIEERWVPYSGFINGVSITVKGQFYRIYVWLCTTRPAYVEFVRDRIKELLKDIPCVQIDYLTGTGDRNRPAQDISKLQTLNVNLPDRLHSVPFEPPHQRPI